MRKTHKYNKIKYPKFHQNLTFSLHGVNITKEVMIFLQEKEKIIFMKKNGIYKKKLIKNLNNNTHI